MPFGILDPRLSRDDELLPGTERLISDRRLVAQDHEITLGQGNQKANGQLKRVTYKVCMIDIVSSNVTNLLDLLLCVCVSGA